MLGGFLAAISAAFFGLNNAVLRRGVLSGSVGQSMAVTVPLGMVMFLVAVPIMSAWQPLISFSRESYLILGAAGIVHFLGNRYFITRAIKALGSNMIGPLQELGLLWSIVLAMLVLGEQLTPGRVVGILLILCGPLLIMTGRRPQPKALSADAVSDKPVFVPKYREGFICSLLSASCWGTSPVLVRMALPEGSGPATGIAAAVVSYVAATVVIALILMLPGRMAHVRSMPPKTAALFTLSGVLVNLSHVFRYMALSLAPVSVVMPIQRSSIVFRLLFAWLFNRDYEFFTWRILVASGLTLTGSIVLTTMGR